MCHGEQGVPQFVSKIDTILFEEISYFLIHRLLFARGSTIFIFKGRG